jgi:hypothetical protein
MFTDEQRAAAKLLMQWMKGRQFLSTDAHTLGDFLKTHAYNLTKH